MKKYFLLIPLLFVFMFARASSGKHETSETEPAQFSKSIRGNGMGFTQNKGQVADMDGNLCPDVLYKGNGAGADIYLRNTGISYVYSNMNEVTHHVNQKLKELEKITVVKFNKPEKQSELMQQQILKAHRVDMDFADCNGSIQTMDEDEVEGYQNFYYAHCPKGVTNVKQFNKVTYKNVYNNIDVSYYGNKELGIKYDIIIQPHTDPKQIKLRWTGMERIQIDRAGNLMIKTSVNDFYESIPKVYQNIKGKTVDVKAKYVLSPSGKAGEALIRFELGVYNPDYTLIIDPTTWVTYYGGSGNELSGSVTTDNNGNVIFSGTAASLNLASIGAFQTAPNGFGNGIIVKFTSSGTRVFATYIGGKLGGSFSGITADNNGKIIVTGSTTSVDFPTLNPGGAYSQSFAGVADMFISQFTPGGALIWSTYYGGKRNDDARDVTTDINNNIIITGFTSSSDFPTLNAFNSSHPGSNTIAIVVKFNSAGVRQWATYYGGTNFEEAYGIACDGAADVFICGETTSADFPVMAAFQPALIGGANGFVTKLNSNTGFPVWSTYYGGGGDHLNSIAVDGSGNVYVEGLTSSTSNISTPGAYQPLLQTAGAASDAFVVKFDNAGLRKWGTYLGGTGKEEPAGIACDKNNNVVVSGDTYSADFPVTSCSYQKVFLGTEDIFITTFDTNGKLICSGLLGAGNATSVNDETFDDIGGCIAIDGCYLYVVGFADCNFPITANAYQTTCGGKGDGSSFDITLSKLYVSTCGGINSSLNFNGGPTSFCTLGQSVNFTSTYSSCMDTTGTTTYLWSFTGGTPSASTSKNPTGIIYNTAGTYDVQLIIKTPCGKDSLIKSAFINAGNPVISSVSPANPLCAGGTGSATAIVAGGTGLTYSWNTGSTGQTISGLKNGSYTVTVTNGSGCKSSKTVSITEPSAIAAKIDTMSPTCGNSNGSAIVTASGGTSGYTYSWSPSGGSGANATALGAGTYTVTITDANSCTQTSTAVISNSNGPATTFSSQTNVICKGGSNGSVTATASGGTTPYSYSWGNGQTTSIATGLSAGTYIATVTDANGCKSNKAVSITEPAAIVADTATIGSTCGNTNGSATVTVSGGTGGYTYNWYPSGGNAATATGLGAGVYTITVTDLNGCTKTALAMINNTSNLGASVSSQINVMCNAGSNGSATIAATGGKSPYTYSWDNGQSSATATGLPAGTYNATVSDASGCKSFKTITITEPGKINTVANSIPACGKNNGSATINANGGTAPFSYQWNPSGQTNTAITGVGTGTYTCIIKDANKCTQSITVSIVSDPGPTISAGINATINTGGSSHLNANGGGSYLWNPATGLTCTTCPDPIASPTITTTYYVSVKDFAGCESVDSVLITVENDCRDGFIPSSFSPDHNGINDQLYVRGGSFQKLHFVIYDRWGEKIFETNDQAKGWDGTYKGKELNPAVFVYYLTATCSSGVEIIKKGNVAIVK